MAGSETFDVAVIGGGIVGMATAMALAEGNGRNVVVLEAEDRLAPHQTGHNSGVIHSGLYYRPGSLKARNCVEGRRALLELCEEENVPYEVCGKLVVATESREIPALDELERRGRENGLQGLERLPAERLREHEPHVAGIDGLWVPETGITDFGEITRAMGRRLEAAGGEVRLRSRVLSAAGFSWRVRAFSPTAWPAPAVSIRASGSCPSGGSTTISSPGRAIWSGTSSTRFRIPASPSSGST